jgi:membrane associated rhomboid family serine protease
MAYRSRSRMGVFYTPGFPPVVKWLLISNSAVFILAFFSKLLGIGRAFDYLALTPSAVVRDFYVWQVATYMFLHAGIWHLVWNMLALWMFGAELEQLWGARRFLNFYMVCGIGAGVCVVLVNYALLPLGHGDIIDPTVGASGAIFGLLMAYAVLFPNRTILFWMIIPMQVKWFVLIIGVVTFMMSFQGGSGISTIAHLGGLLVGWLWLKTPRRTARGAAPSFNPLGSVQRGYRDWRRRRAKKKFEVWMRKHGGDLQ